MFRTNNCLSSRSHFCTCTILSCISGCLWLRAGRSGDRTPVGAYIFRTCPDRPWGPPSLLYNGYRVFPGGKERPWRDADTSLLLVPSVMKEYSYTSTHPMGRTACTEPQCLYKGDLYHFTYITPTLILKWNA